MSVASDADLDFEPDDETESREAYGLVAAVEAPAENGRSSASTSDASTVADSASANGDEDDEALLDATFSDGALGEVAGDSDIDASSAMRAMVFADAGLFSDAVITALGLNAALAADAVRWLGREEDLAGETLSEEDIPIVHTRAEDVGWFYATIFGMPAIVLGAGLFGVRLRRRSEEGRDA